MEKKISLHSHLRLVSANNRSPDIAPASAGSPCFSACIRRGSTYLCGKPCARHLRKLERGTPMAAAKGQSTFQISSDAETVSADGIVDSDNISNFLDKLSVMSREQRSGFHIRDKKSSAMANLAPMARMRKLTESAYDEGIKRRLAIAEDASGIERKVICAYLDISPDTYRKYFKQSPLPPHLIPAFCEITGTDRNWLQWGEGPPPLPRAERARRGQEKKMRKRAPRPTETNERHAWTKKEGAL